MITTWYLQSQRTWDRLCHSCIGSSFLPRGAFPEGGAYAVPQRLHAGSLEALRVSRPEAVVLAVNNQLNTSAFNLGQFVGAGALTENEVRTALSDTAMLAGLGDREIAATLTSGLRAG